MATSRDRFLQTCSFQPVDKPWVRWGAFVWLETGAVWRTQGYDGPELGWEGVGLAGRFELDELLRVDTWYGPLPGFEYKVIEEDERVKVYINHEGILMRELKEHSDTSMPQFVRFPVETPGDFEKFAAERLNLSLEQRFSPTWKREVASGCLRGDVGGGYATVVEDKERDAGEKGSSFAEPGTSACSALESPRKCWADRWGGFFGPLRNMMGLENLCLAFYDQTKLVERMMEQRADNIIEITNEVLKHTSFETFWYWEDMAYNHGSLIDPNLYGHFALKHYRRVNDWLRSRGIRYIGLDSDGDISRLIPLWIESGINMIWPIERQSGMDVLTLRRTYGHDLIIMGGIDKRTLVPGGDVMRHEVDRVMPVVEDGGYFPELDHSIPPDVSWPNFCEYIEYLKERLGRG
ncbi:MAG: hypothetical protein HY663_04255 [Chloroflexi bacterium]|nr:hypothetical protein [Chloroflexota bacterium]